MWKTFIAGLLFNRLDNLQAAAVNLVPETKMSFNTTNTTTELSSCAIEQCSIPGVVVSNPQCPGDDQDKINAWYALCSSYVPENEQLQCMCYCAGCEPVPGNTTDSNSTGWQQCTQSCGDSPVSWQKCAGYDAAIGLLGLGFMSAGYYNKHCNNDPQAGLYYFRCGLPFALIGLGGAVGTAVGAQEGDVGAGTKWGAMFGSAAWLGYMSFLNVKAQRCPTPPSSDSDYSLNPS